MSIRGAHLDKGLLPLSSLSVPKGHFEGGQAPAFMAAASAASELPLPAQNLRLCAPAQPQLPFLQAGSEISCASELKLAG